MQHASEPNREPPPRGGGWVTAGVVLLWFAWVLVPAGLVLDGFGNLLTFFGELPTDAERARARELFVRAAIAAAAIPALGLAVSLGTRRLRNAAAFACALVVGGVAALALVAGTADRSPGSAIPPHHTDGGCQEYSGGDSDCPGG